MKFHVKTLAITCGVLWALTMFLMTVWVVVMGDGQNALLTSFGSFYIGYDISYRGALIGLVYGFIDGLICGAVFGWVYNLVLDKCS